MSGIFISYRRDDTRGSAGRLYDDLSDRFGTEQVFRDIDAIQPGADYRETITRLIDVCDAVVVVIGNRWLDARDEQGARRLDDPDDLVRREVAAALAASKTVIPVLVEDASLPPASHLPDELGPLTRRNALPLSDLRWRYDVGVLAQRLEQLVEPPATSSSSSSSTSSTSSTSATPAGMPVAPTSPGRRWPLPWQVGVAAAVAAALIVTAVVALTGGDGTAPSTTAPGPADLGEPAGLAVDAAGNLFVADSQKNVVRKVAPDGSVTTVAGSGKFGADGDGGPARAAAIDTPGALAVDAAGNLLIAQGIVEGNIGGIRRVGTDGLVTTLPMRSPGVGRLIVTAMAFAPDGTLLIGTAQEVLRVLPDGTLAAVAGSSSPGFAGDGGPATSAKLDLVAGLATTADGSVYIADAHNHRVRRVSGGIITTVAGTGSPSASGDGGPAVEAAVLAPAGLAARADGSVLVATGSQVRRIGPDGTIGVLFGSPDGSSGYSGDGGPATAALLNSVGALASGRDGSLYVIDGGNDRVRRIGPDGIITTVG